MIENNHKEFILLFPHLEENTTSVSRFNSIIKAFLDTKFVTIRIVLFKYPLIKTLGLGHEKGGEVITNEIRNKIEYIYPKVNFIQKISFKVISKWNGKLYKPLNYIHQILYGQDVFTPKNTELEYFKSNHKNGGVIAFGGPYGMLLFAEKLSKKLKYKLIIDYRDPWTFGYNSLDSNPNILLMKKLFQRKKEIKLLNSASIVFTVSETLKSYFPKHIQSKVKVIINGSNYTSDDVNKSISSPYFNITYLGTIYNEQLKDESFFKIIQKLIVKNEFKHLRLQFLGSASNKNLLPILSKYNLLEFSNVTYRLSKNDLKPFLQSTSIFLHLKYGNVGGIITSKQSDYLVFRKPILLPFTDHGDLAESIIKNNAGYVCNSFEETLSTLKNLIFKHNNNENILINSKISSISLSRKTQAERFVNLILGIF